MRSLASTLASACALVLAFTAPAWAQGSVRYVYDAAGRLVGVIAPNGESAVYTYDAVGNLLAITRYPSTGVTIIHFSPGSGPIGTTVTISGTGFSATPSQNAVTFNGTGATVTSATTTELVTTVPAGATTGPIAVTTPNGSATSGTSFTVTASLAPTITGFTPTIGVVGAAVTIEGTNFDPALPNNQVRFNSTLASVTTASATTLGTTVPASGTSGHITVATVAGTAVSAADFFVPPSPYTAADVLVAERMSIGGSLVVGLTTASKIALIVFDANEGQRVSVKVQVTSGGFGCNYSIKIIGPGNSVPGQGVSCVNPGFLEPVLLPLSGTYTLVIDPVGTSTGTATVNLYSVVDVTDPITPDGPGVVAALTTPGQNARLPFTGVVGQRMSVKTNVTSGGLGCNYPVQILKPDGSLLGQQPVCTNPGLLEPLTLTVSGTHTVVVNPLAANTGTVTVNLYDVADVTDPITANGPAVIAALTDPGQNARLPFEGTSGRRMSAKVAVTSGAFGCAWPLQILKPDGGLLGQTTSCNTAAFLEPLTLPVSGTYTLVVNPVATSTGTATINLYDVVDVTDPITPNGGPMAISLTTPGQNALLPFTGVSGHQVTVSATVTSGSFGCAWWLRILKPDGSTLGEGSSCGGSKSIGPLTLPSSGTYTVVVNPAGSATGTANVTLTDTGLDAALRLTFEWASERVTVDRRRR